MKTKLLFIFLLGLCFISQAQENYQEGYIITNDGNRQEVLINNKLWSNNPTEVQFKKSENAEAEKATAANIGEFGIPGIAKYRSYIFEPEYLISNGYLIPVDFEPQKVFMKVLVEGEATLLHYQDKQASFFFYEKDDSNEIHQLKHVKTAPDDNTIKGKIELRRQLGKELGCEGISMDDMSKIRYKEKDLIKYFIQYNECTQTDYLRFLRPDEKFQFHLSVKPGFYFTSLNVELDEQDATTAYRVGAEVEFVLPKTRNKWAIFVEPTYRQPFEKRVSYSNIRYNKIRVPLGARYYLNPNPKNNIFFDAAAIIDHKTSYALGFGYRYTKFSAQMRLEKTPIFSTGLFNLQSANTSLSVIFGYQIF